MAESIPSPIMASKDMEPPAKRVKLTGRAFYESIGSPKMVVAPMVDRSEYAWRRLTRSFLPSEPNSMLGYTPMLHSRLFTEQAKFRETMIQPTRAGLQDKSDSASDKPWLDGNPVTDRPLIVQFCANNPDIFLEAAQYVAPYCDAVDLNLGCPQGIAKKGSYGAFLQEDWDLIYRLINKLHLNLSIPVTAKFRIQETPEKTLEYAKMILSAGASIITVHGRRREQKGHNTGLADWSMIRYLRDNLPPETVIFANGNILNYDDIELCLKETGADGVMSAEGNLSDPSIFARPPPLGQEGREYWRRKDGRGGYRIDAVTRRYFDIIYRDVLEQEPPARKPLFIPGDAEEPEIENLEDTAEEPPKKKQRREKASNPRIVSPNVRYIQPHLFQLFRPFVATYTHIRDALGQCRAGDMPAFENVLALLEKQVKQALIEEAGSKPPVDEPAAKDAEDDASPELKANREKVASCKRPWFVCQPHIRPLPEEAFKNGSLQLSKKESAKLAAKEPKKQSDSTSAVSEPNPTIKASGIDEKIDESTKSELPKEAVVCG